MPDQPNPGTGKASDIRCTEAEPLFAEYLDGTLSASAKARLEAHMATCPACTEALDEVRRGLGWMQLLRADTLPTEPPAGLLDKIIARTTNGSGAGSTVAGASGVAIKPVRNMPWSSVNLAAVRSGVRRTGLLEPRLALTAAMAFFSISVTLSVAGIRPVDLKPTNLRRTVTRTYFDANARVTRYYENMRVVYELESRVRELRRAAETTNRPAPSNQQQHTAPKTTPQSDSTRHPSLVDDGVARKDSKSGQQQKKSDPKESEPEPVFNGDVIEARLNLPASRPAIGPSAFSASTLSHSTELESLTVVPQRSMA
jgi:hypothetical protein